MTELVRKAVELIEQAAIEAGATKLQADIFSPARADFRREVTDVLSEFGREALLYSSPEYASDEIRDALRAVSRSI